SGNFVYTPASGTVLNAGNGQTLHVDFTPTDTTGYNNASKDVTINVSRAHLTVTADNKNKSYDGLVYSPFTATLSGFVNSETDAGLRTAGALTGYASYTGTRSEERRVGEGRCTLTPRVGWLSATN